VYLLHGEDEFSIARFISTLTKDLGDAATAALNITRLEGSALNLDDFQAAAFAMPFLAPLRLVRVDQPLARLNSSEAQKKFIAILEQVPSTSRVVLVEYRVLKEDDKEGGWLLKWALGMKGKALVRSFPLMSEGQMAQWIQSQARELGGQITPRAATLLASLVGSETRMAYHEIQKLLAYVNAQRPVEVEDVESLSLAVFHESIFTLVDALATQNSRQALGLLRRFLDEESPQYVMGMMIRQFRLLLLVKELQDEGRSLDEMLSRLAAFRVKKWELEKLTRQARRFSLAALENAYRRLLDIDEAIKSGLVDEGVALDTFTAAFTGHY
jgi:DNA polymerase-3 subunit delta